MEAIGTRRVVRIGCVALFYAILTISMPSLSFGNVQIRFAEMFMVLCLYSKDCVGAVTVGCFAANIFGPFGSTDVIIGTLATLTAGILIYLSRKYAGVIGAAAISAAVNAPAVSAVILLNDGEGDFKTNVLKIALSELLTVLVAGSILNYHVRRIKGLKQFLSSDIKAPMRG